MNLTIYSLQFVIFLLMFQSMRSDQNFTKIYLDVESTTETIKVSSLAALFPKFSSNFKAIKNEAKNLSTIIQEKGDLKTNFNGVQIQSNVKLSNLTNQTTANSTKSTKDENKIEKKFLDKSNNNATTTQQPQLKNISARTEIDENRLNNSKIEILIIHTSHDNQTVSTEIIKANHTLLSTILLRMHSIVQYSSNFSSQAIIPYVYLAKMQMDGLYKQIVDSTFMQSYLSNMYQLIMNDLMNKECNVISTMANYILIPAFQARGTSNSFIERINEFTDKFSRWQNALQRWSNHLSSTFSHVAELRFEDCGQKLLCSLGKAKYQSLREEQSRQYRTKIIKFINNLFNMPMVEKRMKRNYLEARQLGAAGGDCESLSTNCAIPTENFDAFINLIKQLV